MARRDAKIEKLLRELGEKVAPNPHQQIDPVTGQYTNKTYYDLYAEKVWDKAVAGNEWAMQFVAERTEGKPGSAQIDASADETEERLDDVTTQQLNDLAQSIAAPSLREAEPVAALRTDAADGPAGPAVAKLLALPSNRARRTQAHGGQLAVPPAAPAEG
jgi:hypothetical protein